jgi:hypothetical protein
MDNDFGRSGTTFHLHFEHHMAIAGKGIVPVPLYCDMVVAYEKHTGKTAQMVGGGQRCDGGTDGPGGTPAAIDVAVTPEAKPQPDPGAATAVEPKPDAGPATETKPDAKPVTPAAARYASYWTHSGSEMGLVASGDDRIFAYVAPRAGLGDLVKKGTVLFAGRKSENTYKGKAKVFSGKCPTLEYEVEGPVQDGGRTVILRGKRPIPDPAANCQQTRTIDDVLVFKYKREGEPAEVVSKPVAEAKPEKPQAPGGGPSTATPLDAGPSTTSPSAGPASAASAAVAGIPRCTRQSCVDREPFLSAYGDLYRSVIGRSINPYQRAALNAVLNVWDTTEGLENEKRLAYIIGTVFHESFDMVYPIRECMCRDDEGSIECVRKLHAKGRASAYHLRDRETGHSYYGRGQTQLTLRENFWRIGRNLKLDVDLERNPDASLRVDISAQNAVLGLYHGWYRGKFSLKRYAFDNDSDWFRARDVLISQRRDAHKVARHGKRVAQILRFIPLAEFQSKYPARPVAVAEAKPTVEAPQSQPAPVVEAPSTAAATPAEPPKTEAPVASPAKPDAPPAETPATAAQPPAEPAKLPQPATATATTGSGQPKVPPPPQSAGGTQPAPAAAPSGDATMIARLAQRAAALEQAATGLQGQVAELSRRATELRSAIEFYGEARGVVIATAGTQKSAAAAMRKSRGIALKSAGEDEIDPRVDFISVWPPSHKAHGWCRVAGRKSIPGEAFDDEDPEGLRLLARYEVVALAPEASGQRTIKSAAGDDVQFNLTARPRTPEPIVRAGTEKSAPAEQGPTWWALPPAPVRKELDTSVGARRPEPVP